MVLLMGRCAALVGLLLLSLPAVAQQDLEAERKAAAIARYHEIVSVKDMLDAQLAGVAQQLPIDDKRGFTDFMFSNIDFEAIERADAKVLADTFTVEELEAMANYYESPVGRSTALKMPQYSMVVTGLLNAQLMPLIQRYLEQALLPSRQGQGRRRDL